MIRAGWGDGERERVTVEVGPLHIFVKWGESREGMELAEGSRMAVVWVLVRALLKRRRAEATSGS